MRLNIYHTNDIHANFAFLGRVCAYLEEHRTESDLYLDSGDFLDLKSLVVQADRGGSALALAKFCRMDAMALGNNEIDLGSEDLEKLTFFPLLCANIRRNDGSPVPGLKNHLILERCGKRFLIIGLAPFYGLGMLADKYNVFFEMGNLHTLDPVPAVTQILCENRGKYDFSILLSHSGHAVDRELAKSLPPVDLWLEGHSHSVVTEKCCSQSGMGEFLGRVTLDVQEQGIEILDSVQIELPAQESAEFMYRLGQAQESAEAILSQELPVLRELDFDPFRESEFTNFICDCLKAEFGCDLALMHRPFCNAADAQRHCRRVSAEAGVPKEPAGASALQAEPNDLFPARRKAAGGGKALSGRGPHPPIRQRGRLPGHRAWLPGLQQQCGGTSSALHHAC